MNKSWVSSYEALDKLSFEELKSYLPYNISFSTKREIIAYWIFKNHPEVIAPTTIKQSRDKWLENLYLKYKGTTKRDLAFKAAGRYDTINDQDIFRHSRISRWIGFIPHDWSQEEE
jgi:hypothetical protein